MGFFVQKFQKEVLSIVKENIFLVKIGDLHPFPNHPLQVQSVVFIVSAPADIVLYPARILFRKKSKPDTAPDC